jgi:glycolate oxidase subunit GlcD
MLLAAPPRPGSLAFVSPQELTRALGGVIGAKHVLEAPRSSPYNSDMARRGGLRGRADAVALPGSAQEVAALVRWCYAHDVPIVPRGGGTGLVGGAVPTRGGVVLSLERLRAVRELEPGLWRMFPEAGVRTCDVQRLARESGLFFAPDPGAAEQSQIGGNVATNAGGPHALKYGVTGAWVTGLEAVLAPGELVQVGGWARKDVAGYDLKDLLIGSEGTLGVITAVRLRLRPAPEAAVAFVVALPATEDAAELGCRAMLDVTAAGIQPAALEFLDGETLTSVAGGYPGELPAKAGFALLVELDGERAQVERDAAALMELLGERALEIQQPADAQALWRWRDGFNGVVSGVRGGKVSEDVSFPVERLAEGLSGWAGIATRHGLRSCAWGHGGDGNVHATVLVDPNNERELYAAEQAGAELFELVAQLGGSVAAEHGVGALKSGLLAGQWDAAAVDLHERIKRAFDPKGLLNPGKKLGRAT